MASCEKVGLYDPEKSWSPLLPPRRVDTRSPANWLASDRLNLVPVGVGTVVGVSAARWGREAEDGVVRGELLNRARSGDDVAFEMTWTGTHEGPLEMPDGSELPATGLTVSFSVAVVLETTEGLIRRERQYYDNLGILDQLGVT